MSRLKERRAAGQPIENNLSTFGDDRAPGDPEGTRDHDRLRFREEDQRHLRKSMFIYLFSSTFNVVCLDVDRQSHVSR